MGVEPTAARSARPATDFEDRGIHRDTTTPKYNLCNVYTIAEAAVGGNVF
jgi:hypothetical protein